MKCRAVFFCLLFLTFFTISFLAIAEDQKSPTETYIDELRAQGKERVIVLFKDDTTVNPSLVDKYGGQLIYAFTTIKALVCEMPQENIDLLRKEESVKEVAPDVLIKSQPMSEVPDLSEQAEYMRLKKEYFRNIREARMSARREALQEYLRAIRSYITERQRILKLYNEALIKFVKANKKDKEKYRLLLVQYQEMLRQCEQVRKDALERYHAALNASENIYVEALSNWEVKVDETLNLLLYSGPVTVRWNNLSDGMNSKAAWDKYNLNGAGIKIAFVDQGVNYTLPDINANYLGGEDFVSPPDEHDPFTDDPNERHGTEVVSIAVGEGELKVIGPAYNASYYAVRVTDVNGTGLVSNMIAGIEWASTEPHKADIISISLAAYDEDNTGNPLWPYIKQELEIACNNAYNSGLILIAASGNRSYDHSGYPAACNNVISVGAHNVHQVISDFSDGGVDIVAPGESTEIGGPPGYGNAIVAIGSNGLLYAVSGTSGAAPHAAALLALQLQYAREHNIDVNNGYLWESMKHAAKDLGLDPVYQGKGKIWAAETTNPPPPEPYKGSVDLMTSSIWPFDFNFEYLNYMYLTSDGYPAYYIGTSMYQDITLINLTDIEGNTPEIVEGLDITTIQRYLDTGEALPGASTTTFSSYEPIALDSGTNIVLQDAYYIPWEARPGLYKVDMNLEFKFAGNSRLMKINSKEASIWCPPAIINEGFPVQ